MISWPLPVERSLRSALSAERQAIGIYQAQIHFLKKYTRKDCSIYEEILEEEKSHRSELEESLNGAPPSLFDHLTGFSLGIFLGMLPRKWNYQIHIWAEREAAKAYFLAWKEVRKHSSKEDQWKKLRQMLWQQTKQELSHRKKFQTARKGN